MPSGTPWSVKGINPRARAMAKTAARREGVTLGEWLNKVILEDDPQSGTAESWDDRLADFPGFDDRDGGGNGGGDGGLRAQIARLAERIEAAERRSDLALGGVDQSVRALASRLDQLEEEFADEDGRFEDDLNKAREAHQTVLERVRRLERSGAGEDGKVKAVEAALGKVAARLYETERDVRAELDTLIKRGEERERASEAVLGELAERMDAAEASAGREREKAAARREQDAARDQRANEAMERLHGAVRKVQARIHSSDSRHADTMTRIGEEVARLAQAVDARMADAERRLRSRIDQTRQNTDPGAEIAALEDRVSAIREENAQAVRAIGEQVARLGETLADRVSQAEDRSAAAVEAVGDRVARMVESLERRTADEDVLQSRIAASEERTALRIAEAMKGVHDRFDAARNETAQALSPVQRAMMALAEKLAEIEARKTPRAEEYGDLTVEDDVQTGAAPDLSKDLPPPPRAEPVAPPPDDSFEIDAEPEPAQTDAPSSPESFEAGEAEPLASEHPPTEPDATGADEAAALDWNRADAITAEREPESEADAATPLADGAADEAAGTPDEIEAPDTDGDADGDELSGRGAEDWTLAAPLAAPDAETAAQADDRPDDIEAGPDEADADSALSNTSHDDADDAEPARAERDPEVETGADIERETGQAPEPRRPATLGATADAEFLAAARKSARPNGADASHYRPAANDEPGRGRLVLVGASALGFLAIAAAGGVLVMDGLRPAPEDPSDEARAVADLFGGEDSALRVTEDAARDAAPLIESSREEPQPEASAPPDTDAAEAVLAQTAAPEPGDADTQADAGDEAREETGPETVEETSETTGEDIEEVAGESAADTAEGASRSAQTLEAAATSGDPVARYQLGLERIEAGDLTGGAALMRRAAEQGEPAAQHRYAKMLQEGEGVGEDPDAARDWMVRAAEAGNVQAMYEAGVMYVGLDAGDASQAAAARWFEAAALHGMGDSQFNLALLYQEGFGVPESPADAYAWFRIAAAGGDEDAAARAEDLRGELSDEERAAAEQAAENFNPRTLDPEAQGRYPDQPWEADIAPADIARVQELLNAAGFEAGDEQGVLGPSTLEAIVEYQSAEGLEADGAVNADLIARLEREPAR